jgi:pimeloyl-ACP methyl ester carboxylesterase
MDAMNAVYAVKELNDARIDADKVTMLGHSMGGGVALHALIAQPDLLDAAILYAPVHSQEYDNMHRWRYASLSDQEREERTNRI